jgi:hypothetical protein
MSCDATKHSANVPKASTRDEVLLELLFVVDPDAIERAKRLQLAMRMLRDGFTRRQVSGFLIRHHSIPQQTAWRIVDMAIDLAGPI